MVWTLEDEKCLDKPGWRRKATSGEEKHKHRHLTGRLIHTHVQHMAQDNGEVYERLMRGSLGLT